MSWQIVMANTLKLTLVKSPIGARNDHKQTVRGLGLRRLRQSVELVDTPAVRGMVSKVSYLVHCEDTNATK